MLYGMVFVQTLPSESSKMTGMDDSDGSIESLSIWQHAVTFPMIDEVSRGGRVSGSEAQADQPSPKRIES